MHLTITSGVVLALAALAIAADVPSAKSAAPATQPASVLDFTVTDNAGKSVDLSAYKGKVLLIVNTASKCGNTHQYAGLETMYQNYKDKGFVILAFPANDFGKQEPGTNEQIREFCTSNYKVTFDLFAKIVVKGDGQAPLYKFLTDKQTDPAFAGDITWNFAKFLISRDGKIVGRFNPKTEPEDQKLVKAVEEQLAQK
jgi:glutathione peroxidase